MKLYQEALAHPAVRWPVIIWPPANPAVLVWLERKLSLDISEVCLKAASLQGDGFSMRRRSGLRPGQAQ